MNINEIKSKLAKLLRLSKSSNANEAAVAIQKFETLCVQHGVAKQDITADFDPELDVIIETSFGRTYKKRDIAIYRLIAAVAKYYNGVLMIDHDRLDGKQLKIIASKSNQIQIELYSDFLIDEMERLSKQAKKENKQTPRSFRANFRKGFALAINKRLVELKKAQESQETSQDNQPALVVVEHNQREQKAALSFLMEKYPDIRTSTSRYNAGHGHHEGQDAAQGVGLRKQTEGVTSPTRALTGS
jgi:hypothetical protein|tara:strand:+ start:109 stop:840 length:732 start_codon:yes stop_codon:yes gene_type:complete